MYVCMYVCMYVVSYFSSLFPNDFTNACTSIPTYMYMYMCETNAHRQTHLSTNIIFACVVGVLCMHGMHECFETVKIKWFALVRENHPLVNISHVNVLI